MLETPIDYDVIVVGAGNAALCAALAASEQGAKVLMLEKAPQHQRGGNSYFTDGAIRFAFHDLDDIRKVIPDMSDAEADAIVVPPYPPERYLADMKEVTNAQTDPRMAHTLAYKSFETVTWMAEQGVGFAMIYDNQSFEKNGKHHFWGNLNVKTEGRGVGLIARLFELAEARGVAVWYEAEGKALLQEDGRVVGVRVEREGQSVDLRAGAVVIASGSFEANTEQRVQELGELWQHAVLRGSSHNTGGGLRMALEAGAVRHGQWSGLHNIGTDAGAPKEGDYFDKPGDIYKKHSYPFSIMVNKAGERFVDEGADFRNYTYAKYGREILKQPGHVAYQIFDDRVRHLLRDEYWRDEATRLEANTLEDLAEQLEIDKPAFLQTVSDYNAAVQNTTPFNPHEKDGKGTDGLEPPKTNWANRIDKAPFLAFPVTCGVTFTFGGVKVSEQAEVLDAQDAPIPGLFAAGEMVGGLFYDNYPGGSGLMSGAVFGKLAGTGAAKVAKGT